MAIDEKLVTEWSPRKRAPGKTELSACEMLRDLAKEVPADEHVVEIGSYQGRSTAWLLLGAHQGHGARVTAVDTWDLRKDRYSRFSGEYTSAYGAFKEYMGKVGADRNNLAIKRAYADRAAKRWDDGPVGLLFHDAEHSADAVETDLKAWLPHLSPTAVVALHDACNPEFGVVEGARRALDEQRWDWENALIIPWARRPAKRGLLLVSRRGDTEGGDAPDRGLTFTAAQVREWAAESNVECPEHGPIPLEVQRAYRSARDGGQQ